jgi:hypothetical protein
MQPIVDLHRASRDPGRPVPRVAMHETPRTDDEAAHAVDTARAMVPTPRAGLDVARRTGPWALMRLLHQFKAARQRRDETAFGTPEWDVANDDIERLQHAIFEVSLDQRGAPDDTDDELAEPEHLAPF